MRHNYQDGYSLLSILICNTIGMLLCGTALHFLYLTINTYNKIQKKFTTQNAYLMARHILGVDLITEAKSVNTCIAYRDMCSHLVTPSIQDLISQHKIKEMSDLLIIQTKNDKIIYYLRKSTLRNVTTTSYALYRDDIVHNSIAIAEDVQNFKVNVGNHTPQQRKVRIYLEFNNNKGTEFSCILPQ